MRRLLVGGAAVDAGARKALSGGAWYADLEWAFERGINSDDEQAWMRRVGAHVHAAKKRN